jgi:hypothetical protein
VYCDEHRMSTIIIAGCLLRWFNAEDPPWRVSFYARLHRACLGNRRTAQARPQTKSVLKEFTLVSYDAILSGLKSEDNYSANVAGHVFRLTAALFRWHRAALEAAFFRRREE